MTISDPSPAPLVLFFADIAEDQRALVGGKGLNLARLARAGLPVPPGFVLTTEAFRQRADAYVGAAYAQLGGSPESGGPVAVRSSAIAEDGSAASFAGQQDTFLNVAGAEAVGEAVRRCWDSLWTERATRYREAMGIPDDAAAMAVVVQRMVRAESAGVLFTRDPTDPNVDRMLIEGCWGLGEALVSGRVTPDRWTLDRTSGAPLSAEIAAKRVQITAEGESAVPAECRDRPCLTDAQLAALADLGRRVEALFGAPQDIEWAMDENGALVLLQSRPITAAGDARERVRREEIERLRRRAEPEGTVWARYSLAEVLPEPLPLTAALWRQFLSGGGGYGRMYRELGFDPDPALDADGVIDIIAGRPYFNLSRDARLYFKDFPQEYPFAKLKADPERAIYPTPEPNLARAPAGFWRKFIGVSLQMLRAEKTLERAANEVPALLETEIFPAIARFAGEWRARDLSRLTDAEMRDAFAECRAAVFDRFAPQTLKPSILAGLAIQKLQATLTPALGDEDAARAATDRLLAGVSPEPATDLAGALRDLSAGTRTRDEFLRDFGHRGPGEMELANPRWRETPDALPAAPGGALRNLLPFPPQAVGIMSRVPVIETGPPLADVLAGQRANVQQGGLYWERARRFTALREAGKHRLMQSYEILRLVLLEMDRRANGGGGIFYLEPSELGALAAGSVSSPDHPRERGYPDAGTRPDTSASVSAPPDTSGADFRSRIAGRRRRRALALGLEAPRVLFSDDLDALGRPAPPPDDATTFQGTGVSPGTAEGAALVLRSPDQAPADARDFLLVCPSTDPGWVPLFLRARGVVLETGGVLSHGAIVARELGLPAVANVPDACTRIRTGQNLRVDGGAGQVWLLNDV